MRKTTGSCRPREGHKGQHERKARRRRDARKLVASTFLTKKNEAVFCLRPGRPSKAGPSIVVYGSL